MAPTKKPSIAPTPQLSSLEFDSLHDFYNATHGPWWRWQNVSSTSVPWNFSIPNVNPCLDYWQGLQCLCGLTTCEVIVIYLDHHNLTGHLPDSMRNFPKMQSLILRGNNITGTITESIGSMSELEQLDLSYNHFSGEIPSSIGNLGSLQILNLGANRLSAISIELYELTNLQALSIFENRLKGLLSPNIGNLTSLRALELQVNQFSPQPIPLEICRLNNLQTIDLSQNLFNGILPPCLYGMENLISVAIFANNINGTVSDRIGNLTNLINLDISGNFLYGPLPSSIGDLINLVTLELDNNYFTSTVPHSITNLTNLRSIFLQNNLLQGKIDFLGGMNITLLYLHQNLFTGSFPIQNNGLLDCFYFDLSENLLTGSLPWNADWRHITIYQVDYNYWTGILPAAANYSDIVYFVSSNNYLSFTIPVDFLAASRKLYYLDVTSNLLTGSIPGGFGNFTFLNQLLLSSNVLSGTLPDLTGDALLVVLDISSNALHGTIPSTLTSLRYIEEIFIADNAFTGELNSFLNASRQQVLVNIDVSENEFSGTIPVELFNNSLFLQSFAASSNCFEGSIPAEICGTNVLTSLALDGLTTSTECKEYFFQGIPYFNGFTVSHFLQGTIPSCLYEMPHLELLHLSGNGLSGTIPDNLNISTVLTDLSLSHNSLSGTIPANLQHRSWQNLDLSYNKLSGTLSSSFYSPFVDDDYGTAGPEGSIILQINRLSGNIPTNLIHSDNVQILEGNIFGCNLLESDLPRSDPDYSNYSCGSENANDVLYVWIGLFVSIPLVLLFALYRVTGRKEWAKSTLRELFRRLFDYWKTWKEALRSDPANVNLPRLSIYFSEMRRGTLKLALYCTLILIPLFSILKMDYSSYTIEYAWSISAMLMNGEVAAILLFLGLMCFAVLYLIIFKQIVARLNVRMPKEKGKEKEEGKLSEAQYRSSSEDKESGKAEVSENLRDAIIIYSLVSMINLIIMGAADFSYVFIVINYSSVVTTLAAFGLALFRLLTNNIILWRALPETAKFLDWLKDKICNNTRPDLNESRSSAQRASADVKYSTRDISFLENLILFNNIIIPGIAIIFILRDCFYNALFAADNVQSTYTYNSCYQYSPVIGATHHCRVFESSAQYSPPFIYSYQCSSKIVINYVPVYVLMFILVGIVIPLLKLFLKVWYDRLSHEEESRNGRFRVRIESLLPEYFKDMKSKAALIRGSEFPRSTISSALSMTIFGRTQTRLFSKLTMTVQTNSYLAILVCIGALFPPLAIIAALTICSITYFEELWIGWLLTETRQLGLEYRWYEEQIEKECEGVEESSNLTIWSTLLVSCSLYGYIIFDTMGDKTGWEAALPMTLLMMLLPIFCFFGIKIRELFLISDPVEQMNSLQSSIGNDDLSFGETNSPLRQVSKIQLISTDRFSLSTTQNTIHSMNE